MIELLKSKSLGLKKAAQSIEMDQVIYFVPGVFLVFLALALVAAPGLLVFFMAGFFMASGFCLCFVAWKLLTLKKKVELTLKEIGGKVVIHGMELGDPLENDEAVEGKKIVYH